MIENEEKRPEPECVVKEEGKGLESKPIQPDCIIENEEKKSVEKKVRLIYILGNDFSKKKVRFSVGEGMFHIS